MGQGVPPVVVVVPARTAGEHLTETLRSLRAQDYPSLSLLVIDTSPDTSVTRAVATVAPEILVLPLAGASFAAAANSVASAVEGAVFYLVCHDDVSLGPHAVQAMVNEAFRANAGIVGAKLVHWDEPDQLLSVGERVDRFGATSPIAERGELDQHQHDVEQDVFVVSSAALLIRADLFDDLGGFSEDTDLVGMELDLCWRALIAGGRTVLAPAAVARHAETSPLADTTAAQEREALRSQLRALLVSSSGRSLLAVAPIGTVVALLDVIINLVLLRFSRLVEAFAAVGWNLVRLPNTLAARRQAQSKRRVSDAAAREIRLRGSARLTQHLRSLRTVGSARVPGALATARELPANWAQDGTGWVGPAVAAVVSAVVLFGSRELITGGVPAVRELLPVQGAGEGLRHWWSGWSAVGLGSGIPTLRSLLLSLLTWLSFDSRGFIMLLLVLVPLLIGPLGVWRSLPSISLRARSGATLAYTALGVARAGVAEGRLSVLVVSAILPWIWLGLVRAAEVEPFRNETQRSVWHHGIATGLGLGIAAGLALVAIPVAAVFALVVVGALGAVGWLDAARRAGSAALLTLGVAVLLNLPQVADVLWHPERVGSALSATRWTTTPSAVHIFSTDLSGAPAGILLLAAPIAALVVLVFGHGWRSRWGAVTWSLVAAGWLCTAVATWLSDTRVLPDAGVLLAGAALGLSLAIGFGIEAFENDVVGARFGWRQLVGGAAALLLVLAGLPVLIGSIDGRWQAPASDVHSVLAALDQQVGQSRVLWVGRSDDLPVAAIDSGDGVALGLSRGAASTLQSRSSYRVGAEERALVTFWRGLLEGRTRRAAADLARWSVSYVVVMSNGTGLEAELVPELDPVVSQLSQQFDLAEVVVAPGLSVYRASSAPPLVLPKPGTLWVHRFLSVIQLLALVGCCLIAAGLTAGSDRKWLRRAARRRRLDETPVVVEIEDGGP